MLGLCLIGEVRACFVKVQDLERLRALFANEAWGRMGGIGYYIELFDIDFKNDQTCTQISSYIISCINFVSKGSSLSNVPVDGL